jgi:hypothetical protein
LTRIRVKRLQWRVSIKYIFDQPNKFLNWIFVPEKNWVEFFRIYTDSWKFFELLSFKFWNSYNCFQYHTFIHSLSSHIPSSNVSQKCYHSLFIEIVQSQKRLIIYFTIWSTLMIVFSRIKIFRDACELLKNGLNEPR